MSLKQVISMFTIKKFSFSVFFNLEDITEGKQCIVSKLNIHQCMTKNKHIAVEELGSCV